MSNYVNQTQRILMEIIKRKVCFMDNENYLESELSDSYNY